MTAVETLITDHLDIWTSAIKKKSASGRGSGKKLELYGIKKLRELILELAVRGLLVPQDPSDEPASELLKKIKKEKERLVQEGKIKKQKPLPPITDEEKPFELPRGWEWCRLGEITNTNTGYAFKSTQYAETGTFVLRVVNIDVDGSINKTDVKYICPESAKDTYSKFALSKDDILLVMVGGSLGKLGVVSEDALPAVLNQNMWKLEKFCGMPVRYFLDGLRYINRNQLEITKSTHGHLSQGQYLNKLFPAAPLKEQHRIVAKVNDLMTLCDQLEQQQESSISAHETLVKTLLDALVNASERDEFEQAWSMLSEHFHTLFTTENSIDQLKQTILQLAVMGKLVRQDPNDEPSSELLKKIKKEKERLVQEGKIKKQKPLPPITDEEKPFELPEGWGFVRLDDILDIQSGITKGRKLAGRETTTIPYLSVANVQRSYLDLLNVKEIAIPVEEKEKYEVLKGDLLITEGGDWDKVGRTAIWGNQLPYVAHQNHVFKARKILLNQNEQWIEKYLNSPFARDYFAGSSKQTTNLASINKTQLRGCICAIPPTGEQQRIIAKVNDIMTLCDNLKAGIETTKNTQLKLANAMAEEAI